MSATWKTEYGTKKARTSDPDEAIDILLGEALDAVPELSRGQFDNALRRLQESWGDLTLVNGTPKQVAPLLRRNARRFSGESGFREFEIVLLEPPSYENEEAVQIYANFAHHAIAARVWKTKGGVHVSGAQWLKGVKSQARLGRSRATKARAAAEGTVQVRNRLGFGDHTPLLVEEKPDLERIFADPAPKPPQVLTDRNRDYWAEWTPAQIRRALVSAYLEHGRAAVRAKTLRIAGDQADVQQLADLLADRAKSVRAAAVNVIWDRSPGPAPGSSTLAFVLRILYDEIKAPGYLTNEQALDALRLLRDARPDRIDDFGKWLIDAWVYEEESLTEHGCRLLDLYAQHGTFRDAAEEPVGQLGAEIEQVGGSRAVQEIYEAVELTFGEEPAGELAWAWCRLPLPDNAWDRLVSLGEDRGELLSHLLREGGTSTRIRAVEGLGEIGDTRAVDMLMEALEYGEHSVRLKAAVALGQIGDVRAVDALANVVLRDKGPDVRKSAVDALHRLKTPETMGPLTKALEDVEPDVRESAVVALGRFKTPETVDLLAKVMDDKDPNVRKSAVDALGKFKTPETVDLLVKALEDGDPRVRKSAVVALGKIKDPEMVGLLANVLKDKDPDVRKSAVDILGRFETPETVDLLVKALKDKDSDIRKKAAEALERIGDPRSTVGLVQALGDENFSVRTMVSYALERMVDSTVVRALVKATQDRRKEVRSDALEILGRINNKRVVPDLVRALGHRDPAVRRQAVVALGRIQDERAVEPLRAALQDRDRQVRLAVTTALSDMDALPPMVKAVPPIKQPAGARPYPSLGRAASPLPQRTVARQTAAVNLLAVMSLVLGILSVPMTCFAVLGLLLGIGALLCGFFGLRQVNLSDGKQRGKGIAIAGLVIGGCGLLLSLVMGLLSLMLPVLMSSGQ